MRCGKMFRIAGCSRSSRLTDVTIMAVGAIAARASVIVYDPVKVKFLYLVLWMDKMLSEAASRLDGG